MFGNRVDLRPISEYREKWQWTMSANFSDDYRAGFEEAMRIGLGDEEAQEIIDAVAAWLEADD